MNNQNLSGNIKSGKVKSPKIKSPTKTLIGASLLCLTIIGGLLMWQYKLINNSAQSGPPAKERQVSLATNATFEVIKPDDPQIKNALQATDLAKAKTLLNQKGAFFGTVTDVRSSAGNRKVVLDFAAQRETAMRATVKIRSFVKFPRLETLIGKKVLIYGIFAPHEGRAEIDMTEPSQLKVID